MWVTWTTFNSTADSIVNYGEGVLNMTATGTQTDFVDGGNERRHLFIHRVLLKDLVPGRNYGNSKMNVSNIVAQSTDAAVNGAGRQCTSFVP